EPGRGPARVDAARAPADRGARGRDDALRDPQPGRGPLDVRPRHRAVERAGRADRDAARRLRIARQRVRRRITRPLQRHRLPRAGSARRRAGGAPPGRARDPVVGSGAGGGAARRPPGGGPPVRARSAAALAGAGGREAAGAGALLLAPALCLFALFAAALAAFFGLSFRRVEPNGALIGDALTLANYGKALTDRLHLRTMPLPPQ